MWIPRSRQDIIKHLNEPLFKNSYYLMANMLLTASSGFFFWILAARLYTIEEVGLGSALISAMGLLSTFSLLGFDIGLIRYLPREKDGNGMINSCFTIAALAALLLALVFIFGLDIWSPVLMVLREHTIFGAAFVLFTIGLTLFGLQTTVFVAFREVKHSFIQALVSTTLRIVILPFLIALEAFGVFLSAGLATAIAVLVGNMLIPKVFSVYRPIPMIKKKMVNDMLHYSFGNHVANIFYFLPVSVLPLLVVNVLGREINAYFYAAWLISAVLLMIPFATSKSLLAESSFSPDDLRQNVIRSLKFIFALLIPAIIGIFIFGRHVLLLFGEAYAKNAFDVLLLLSIASIPHVIIVIYVIIKRINQEIMPAIYAYGAMTVLTIIGSYVLIHKIGLVGIGISWVFGNSVVAGAVMVKMNLSIPRSRIRIFQICPFKVRRSS